MFPQVISCYVLLTAVGFGGMGLSFAYGPRKSEEDNFEVLSHAADIGVTFWDTADVYGFGHNEGTLNFFRADGRVDWEMVCKDRTS